MRFDPARARRLSSASHGSVGRACNPDVIGGYQARTGFRAREAGEQVAPVISHRRPAALAFYYVWASEARSPSPWPAIERQIMRQSDNSTGAFDYSDDP